MLRLRLPRKHLSCCKYLSIEIPTKYKRYSYRYSSVLLRLYCMVII